MPSTWGRTSVVRRERTVATYSDVRSTGFGSSTVIDTATGPPPPIGCAAVACPLLSQAAMNGTTVETSSARTNVAPAFGRVLRNTIMSNL